MGIITQGLSTQFQSLDLVLTPQNALQLLQLGCSFPNLSHLRFSLAKGRGTANIQQKAIEAAVNFIERASSTLESLAILSPEEPNDFGQFLHRLPLFYRLKNYEVCPNTFTNSSTILDFLQRNSDTITKIIYSTGTGPHFRQGLSQLEMKHLARLTMRLSYIPNTPWWTLSCPFFTSISSTLKVLHFEGATTNQELFSLLYNLDALEELRAAMKTLSIDAIVEVAKRAPTLRRLDLRIHDVIVTGMYPISVDDSFPYTTVSSAMPCSSSSLTRRSPNRQASLNKPTPTLSETSPPTSCLRHPGNFKTWESKDGFAVGILYFGA